MEFTPEQFKKAKNAKCVEDILVLAKENGCELTEAEAAEYFAKLHKDGALADEELDNVTGGCGDKVLAEANISSADPHCPGCGDNLYKVMGSNSRPVTYTDEKGEYNLYGCTKCKVRYRHHWNGDLWTKD